MKEKKSKKAKPKKSKYDITVKLTGNPDAALKTLLNAKKKTS